MLRWSKKLVSVFIALLLVLSLAPGAFALDVNSVVMEPIEDIEVNIFPDLYAAAPIRVPVAVEPADAALSVTATSNDKATIAVEGDELVIMPLAAGTLYVSVLAGKEGYAPATQTFAVEITEQYETGEYNWEGSAKVGGSGYATGAVFSQIEENVLYAKTDIGGAYRYDFENDYWIGLNDDATDHSNAYSPNDPNGPGRGATFVISIMPDPVKPGRVYMAAGGSATNAAIYRSENYGDTWQRFPIATTINGNDGANRSTGERLAIDPKNNNIVYFASQTAGLWKSTNAGETFTRVSNTASITDVASPVNYRPTFVTIDPNSPVDDGGNSKRILVGTIGSDTNTPPTVQQDSMQHRPYKSIFVSEDGAATFAEMPNQPEGNALRRYGGFVAMHHTFDWDGKLVVAYAEWSLNNFSQVGSNSNFAQDGRVYRFDLDDDYASEDITPNNVYTAEHPAVSEEMAAGGQVMQRGGISGISMDRQRPGVMVASSFHRHQNFSEEVVWYTSDYGANWKVLHSEVVGIKDLRGVGYIDKDNGWGAAVHWAFNIQINPYNSNNALFTTGNGFWMTKNLQDADEDKEITWGFWDDGFEETVIWNLYSPTETEDYLFSSYADWGSMSWGKDYTVSPKNATVNTESPHRAVQYQNPEHQADGTPNYTGTNNTPVFYQKPGFYERWIDTQNLDYAGLNQNVWVLTPSGNYQNTNSSAGAISFDAIKSATPLAVPSGIAGNGPANQNNAGWISITADASTVVWSVSGQGINNTYWADISDGPDSAVVGSHEGRPRLGFEERVQVKYGDRTAWTKSQFFNTSGAPVTTGNVKIFSDKVEPKTLYGFSGTTFYVSEDGGKTFNAQTIGGDGPLTGNTNWNVNGHNQGQNRIQINPFTPRSVYMASNNTANGLMSITYDPKANDGNGGWISKKLATGNTFKQVGIGIGQNAETPALYAVGQIADTVNETAAYWGVYRSFDGGVNWERINDNQHQFGDMRALSGDSRVLGRVYLGTGTRGIRVADVEWRTVTGPADKGALEALIAEAEAIQSAGYTPATWAVFAQALTNAKAVLVNTEATPSQVTEALYALQDAMDGLAIAVTNISLQPEHTVLNLGNETTVTLDLVAEPAGAPLSGVVWTTSDPATVSIPEGADGPSIQVTAVKQGSAVITAKVGGYTTTATVDVQAAPIVAVDKVDILTDKVTINKAKEQGTLVSINITKPAAPAIQAAGLRAASAANASQIIESVSVTGAPSGAVFTAVAESDRHVRIDASIATPNKTYKGLGLAVKFKGLETPIETPKTLQVVVQESYPKISLTANQLNMFYSDAIGTVTGTAADGSAVTITKIEPNSAKPADADNVEIQPGNLTYKAKKAGSDKLKVTMTLAGYKQAHKSGKNDANGEFATVTAKVVNTKPKLKLSPASIVLGGTLNATVELLPGNAKDTLASIGTVTKVTAKRKADSTATDLVYEDGKIILPASYKDKTGKTTIEVTFANRSTPLSATLEIKAGNLGKASISSKPTTFTINKDHHGVFATVDVVPNISNLELTLTQANAVVPGITVTNIGGNKLQLTANSAQLTAGNKTIEIKAEAAGATFSKTLKLTVKVTDKPASYSVTLKDKIDVLNSASAATATVKLTNTTSTLNTVTLTGPDAGKFRLFGISGATFKIAKADDVLLTPGAKYVLGVNLSLANGQTLTGKTIAITPTQSTAKVSQSAKAVTLYKKTPAQGAALNVSITSPAGAAVGIAQINEASVANNPYFELVRNGDENWTVKFAEGFDPSTATLKTSYTVKLEFWVEGTYDILQSSGKPIALGTIDANGKFTARSKPIMVSVTVNIR